MGVDRLHGEAVRHVAAVAAALADQLVDERKFFRVFHRAALAAAALLGLAALEPEPRLQGTRRVLLLAALLVLLVIGVALWIDEGEVVTLVTSDAVGQHFETETGHAQRVRPDVV